MLIWKLSWTYKHKIFLNFRLWISLKYFFAQIISFPFLFVLEAKNPDWNQLEWCSRSVVNNLIPLHFQLFCKFRRKLFQISKWKKHQNWTLNFDYHKEILLYADKNHVNKKTWRRIFKEQNFTHVSIRFENSWTQKFTISSLQLEYI